MYSHFSLHQSNSIFISSGQLLGHFLTFDNGARDAQAVCNQMYSFLEENDVGRANKHSIVHALAELADYKKLFKFDL